MPHFTARRAGPLCDQWLIGTFGRLGSSLTNAMIWQIYPGANVADAAQRAASLSRSATRAVAGAAS